jgi:hypothetical protein
MIGPMRTLLRLKQLKENESLRLVNKRREEVAVAAKAEEAAAAREAESRATMGAREDRIYDEIVGKVVDLSALEETKAKVVQLEKGHTILIDESERAKHVKARADSELDAAMTGLRKAMKDKYKYVIITDELQSAADQEGAAKEELEIEDLTSGRRKKASAP